MGMALLVNYETNEEQAEVQTIRLAKSRDEMPSAAEEKGINKKGTEVYHLWWYDLETKKNLSAGVAFYDPKFGEYRMKIDMHPETVYYLRPISTNGSRTYFRIEIVLKKDGKYFGRKSVGEGHQGPETHQDIYMALGPYSKILILGTKKN